MDYLPTPCYKIEVIPLMIQKDTKVYNQPTIDITQPSLVRNTSWRTFNHNSLMV